MQAHSKHSVPAVTAATMLFLAALAAPSTGDPPSQERLTRDVPVRPLMKYFRGAWTAPCAILLQSKADWKSWDHELFTSGRAMSEEAAPPGVNWAKEAVLVVSLGMIHPDARRSVDVARVKHVALHTDVELSLDFAQGGPSPSVIVAIPTSMAKKLRLTNGKAAGLPEEVAIYTPTPLAAAAGNGSPLAVSWGAIKDVYRR